MYVSDRILIIPTGMVVKWCVRMHIYSYCSQLRIVREKIFNFKSTFRQCLHVIQSELTIAIRKKAAVVHW